MRRRILSVFLALSLCLVLFSPSAGAAETIYFTAVNDNVLPLTADTMPLWSGGTLYVPYTVFDSSVTGISLGIYCNYNRNEGILMFISLSQILTFDLNNNTCTDSTDGEVIGARALMRSGKPYVPVGTVCLYFNLTSSFTAIKQGYLIRIKSSSAILSDSRFIDAANNLINMRLKEYNQSQESAKPSDPVPSVPANPLPGTQPSTPSVVVPNQGTGTGTGTGAGTGTEEPAVEVPTFMGFPCRTAESASAILEILNSRGLYGAIFLTPEIIRTDPNLVRNIIGTGQMIGIYATGEDLDSTRALLTAGNEALASAACARATLAVVPGDFRNTLSDEGWICWRSTVYLTPEEGVGAAGFASNAMKDLDGRTSNTWITVDGPETSRILPQLLTALDKADFVVSLPLEIYL